MKAVFLQTRLNSTRLPRKALSPIGGIPIVEWCMRRLKQVESDIYVLLTCERDADVFKPYAARCGFAVFAGSEEDVLNRFATAALFYRPEWIIRATGDNPFVSPVLAEETFRQAVSSHADYAVLEEIPTGSSVEVARTEALLKAAVNAKDSYEREHVMPYLYRHPEEFILIKGKPPAAYRSSLSVTVDTEADRIRIAEWAAGQTPESFSLKRLIVSCSRKDGSA